MNSRIILQNQIFCFITILFFFTIFNLNGTIVKSNDNLFYLGKQLPPKEKEIIEVEEEDETAEITTEDDIVIYTSKGKQVFVPQRKQWVKVSTLKSGESFLKKDGSNIIIKDIKKRIKRSKKRYDVMSKHHNVAVEENNILMHNPTSFAGAAQVLGEILVQAAKETAKAVAVMIAKEVVAEGIEKATGKDTRDLLNISEMAYHKYQNLPPDMFERPIDIPTPVKLDPFGNKLPVFDSVPRDPNGGIIFAEKAPGNPQNSPGADAVYEPPKRWDGKKVPSANGRGWGYPDKEGRVWVPTGDNGHGGAHWDVQPKGGKGKHENIMPDGTVRGEKK